MSKLKIVVLLLTIAILLSSQALAMSFKPKTEKYPQIGNDAIDFSLLDLNNKTVKLSNFRGKIVFLNFFSTTCPYCVDEMASMQRLNKELEGRNFEMLAVSLDPEGEKVVSPFVFRGGYTFKFLLDVNGDVSRQYFVRSVPTTYIIDGSGRIIDKVVGETNWADESVIKQFKDITQ